MYVEQHRWPAGVPFWAQTGQLLVHLGLRRIISWGCVRSDARRCWLTGCRHFYFALNSLLAQKEKETNEIIANAFDSLYYSHFRKCVTVKLPISQSKGEKLVGLLCTLHLSNTKITNKLYKLAFFSVAKYHLLPLSTYRIFDQNRVNETANEYVTALCMNKIVPPRRAMCKLCFILTI